MVVATISLSIPLNTLDQFDVIRSLKESSVGREIYVLCQKGFRSIKAIEILANYGIKGVNVNGGIEAWNKATID